jgi:hypothetical protein
VIVEGDEHANEGYVHVVSRFESRDVQLRVTYVSKCMLRPEG